MMDTSFLFATSCGMTHVCFCSLKLYDISAAMKHIKKNLGWFTNNSIYQDALEHYEAGSQWNGTFMVCFVLPQVDDVLETKLVQQFKLVMDKGTLDAIGLHPDGSIKR